MRENEQRGSALCSLAYIDPSHVPFLRTDGSSRAYKFLAPEVAPEYTDVVQVESTPEPEQSTSASSSSRVIIKPAAKKTRTQEIPVRLGPVVPGNCESEGKGKG